MHIDIKLPLPHRHGLALLRENRPGYLFAYLLVSHVSEDLRLAI